jgi:leucyl-tRNA synthetase
MNYNFKQIEEKWKKTWNVRVEKPNYFVLSMWPYPSGKLHMGHLRNYLLGDIIARFKTMQGFKVLHPMGWDAFGLPAENAAIEKGVSPAKWTLKNISNMKEELIKIGFSFDWSREETSCLPNYYKHEQKMFLDFYKNGIAYKKESVVNWDPVDNTVLANEQVIDGKGWRSGADVEKRFLSQWFLKISEFSAELLEGLKTLEKWPEKVRTMQENWIGKSEGAEIDFAIEDAVNGNIKSENLPEKIKIFTTRPETLCGASFIAISYAHPVASEISSKNQKVKDFIKECELGSTKAEDVDTAEKKGFFTGLYCINPENGERIPVYIANFVLMEYGTGAIFGCPAHDQRDYDFAVKYSLPIKQVINGMQPSFDGIETENFIIRPFKESDLKDLTETLLELNENPHWVKEREPEEKVLEDARKKLDTYINWQKEQGFSRWAVTMKNTMEFVGGAGFCFFLPHERSLNPDAKKTDIELGYWFRKKFHGKGYATEIISAIVKWAEENLHYTKITAVTDPENKISQKVLGKMGFERKGDMFHTEYGIENFFLKLVKPKLQKPFTEDGILANSNLLNGMSVKEAREKSFAKYGKKVNYRLKDWGVSRQRYWGCPIPVINCKACGIVPVPEKDLPVILPEDAVIEPGENPLKKHPTWRFVKCPSCGCEAERETDTLDTFFESSWYFLRFSGKNDFAENGGFAENVGSEKAFENPLKVNDYVGGIEHAILHLLYARFFTRALKKCGYPISFEEPFERLITQGMVCHKTFQTLDGKWLTPEEASTTPPNFYTIGASIKMSKSKKNVIEPAVIVNEFGADTARFFMASDNPPERDMEWSDEGVASAHKFLTKLWNFAFSLKDVKPAEPDLETLKILHKNLASYSKEIEAIAFNKSVAKIRELSNLMFASEKGIARFLIEPLIACISPISPSIANEIAEILGFKIAKFPEIKTEFLEDETCIISIQINGKLRGTFSFAKGVSKEEVKKVINENAALSKHLEGKEIKKEIFVLDKILNFVV